MGRERDNEGDKIELTLIEGITLTVAKEMARFLGAEAEDYDIWINGLNPLEENEKYLRDLTIPEIGTHCLITGMYNQCVKHYSSPSLEGAVLFDLLRGLKEAALNTGLDMMGDLQDDRPRFWGLRRHKGKAVWVERPPDMREMLKGMNVMDLRPFK